jgi:DNA-binding NtrC family response regulator
VDAGLDGGDDPAYGARIEPGPDELGDMSPATQVKVLRALQERTIRRVGGVADIRTNVRIICATHRSLEEEVAAGRFREDLYFRLMVYPLAVPPLRERAGDVPSLTAHFLHALRDDVGRDISRVATGALAALTAHRRPGNVRELQNVVHRAMLSCEGDEVRLADLPPALGQIAGVPADAPSSPGIVASLPCLDLQVLERLAIQQALDTTGMHIWRASTLLGIGRSTLYRRLIELDLVPREMRKAC